MKVFNALKCPDPDFSIVESDQMLTTLDGHEGSKFASVLIDSNGNVLTREEM